MPRLLSCFVPIVSRGLEIADFMRQTPGNLARPITAPESLHASFPDSFSLATMV